MVAADHSLMTGSGRLLVGRSAQEVVGLIGGVAVAPLAPEVVAAGHVKVVELIGAPLVLEVEAAEHVMMVVRLWRSSARETVATLTEAEVGAEEAMMVFGYAAVQ